MKAIVYCSLKNVFRFLFMTGLRLGEALALNWEDVDFDSKVVYINKTMLVKNKREFRTTTPKTKVVLEPYLLTMKRYGFLKYGENSNLL